MTSSRTDAGLDHCHTPSNSKDEWGTAFLELSKVVIEGFQISPIKSLLQDKQIQFQTQEQSLSLLRKLLSVQTGQDEERLHLEGLRQVQRIRSKVQSHRSGSEADEMAKNALSLNTERIGAISNMYAIRWPTNSS